MLLWPYRDLPVKHPAFVAINRLAARRALPINARKVDFRASALADVKWRQEVKQLAFSMLKNSKVDFTAPQKITRGEFCQQLWDTIKDQPLKEFQRKKPNDADGDGLLDINDALPFDSKNTILEEP